MKFDNDTDIIVNKLYPLVEQKMDKNSNRFKRMMGDFITTRHKELYEIAPYDRIYFNKKDVEKIYLSIGITEQEVVNIMKECFYWKINYTPKAAQEPYVVLLMTCIRYYILKKDEKMAELTAIFTSFTGKFYASLHSNFWEMYTPRQNQAIMEYVVNNMLSDKFDLKTEGSIFGAIKKLCITYLNKYKNEFARKDLSDDEMGKLIQQLRDRIKSFLYNIAKLYYEAVETKAYMNYETDSLDPDEFRITDSDALKAARITEATVQLMTSQKIDLKAVDNCHDHRVSSKNIKSILESILSDNNNIPDIKWVINVMICDFMSKFPGREIGSIDFISYTDKAKPNTKDPYLLKSKQIVIKWLNNSNILRKCTDATINSYYKAVLMYFTLMVSKVALKG